MRKVFNRTPITESLIEILGSAQIGDKFTFPGLAERLQLTGPSHSGGNQPAIVSSPIGNIRGNISYARKFLKKTRGIVFGSIRGVGIQRMNPDEIALSNLGIVRHISRQAKEGKVNNDIVRDESLSKEAANTVIVTDTIFEKMRQESKAIKARIQIATIDGASMLTSVMEAKKLG